MSRSLLSLPVLLVCVASAYLEGVPGQQARHDLDQRYRAHDLGNFEGAVEALHSSSPYIRQYASAYLLALYRGAWEDETTGRVPWHATPYWGGPSESDARELRSSLAREIGEGAQGEEAVAVVAWALRHERATEIRTSLAGAIPRLTGPAADALVVDLLSGKEGNRTVLLQALVQVRTRRLLRAKPAVLRLLEDPRPSIQRAASDAAAAFSWNIAPASPDRAFPDWLNRTLADVSRRVLDPIPPSAPWAIFRTHRAGIPDSVGWATLGGWWLSQGDTTVRCLDWFGRVTDLPRKRTEITFGSFAEAESLLTWARRDPGKDFMTQRRQQALLSREGPLTAQFEPQGMSLPEALVAAWAAQRGERATARAILGPRLEALEDGNDLDPICRDLQGTIYHLAMLDRFSLDRDYAETIRIARHLSMPEFDGYEYQGRAHELAQQLSSRGADFHSFRLPDSAAWAGMRSRMSRKSQIAYLAERLRLLDCYQMMQPGGVSLWEPQYAEATHKETVWSPVRNRSPKVINPSVELDGMHLDIDDLPALAPFLLDRNFTLTYEFWRDFHPDRTLYRVNMLVAHRIHSIAGRDLAGLDDFGKLSPEQQRERVAAVEKWAGAHHGWTKRDLALESLRMSPSWSDVREAIAYATEQHLAEAAPLILSRLDAFPEFPAGRRFLLQDACALDSASAAAASRRLLHDSDLDVRLTAIRILLRGHGQDVDLAIGAFRDLERADPYRYWSIEAFDDLLASGRPEAHELAAKALKADTYLSGGDDAMRVAQRLFLLGRHEALSYLENQLWNPMTTWVYGPSGGGAPITTSVQDRTANDLTLWRNDMQPIAPSAPEEERVHRRRELQAWLEDQFARIWAHQPSSIVPLSTRRP